MNAQQRHEHREFYNQLRLALVYPGDTIAGVTKLYTPVNKDNWTWEMAMSAPDTPTVARERRYEKTMWFSVGARLAS